MGILFFFLEGIIFMKKYYFIRVGDNLDLFYSQPQSFSLTFIYNKITLKNLKIFKKKIQQLQIVKNAP